MQIFSLPYSELGYSKRDFEFLRDELKKFGYAGFVCISGDWKGISHDAVDANPELASPSVCALGLMESFNMSMSMSHAYIDVPQFEYDTILSVLRDCEAKNAEQMLLASVRKTVDKESVRLLMSPEKILSLRTVILRSPHEWRSEAFQVMETIFEGGMKKWARMCRRELVRLQLVRPLWNQDLFHGVSFDAF